MAGSGYYAYEGIAPLGEEPVGGSNKMIRYDLKTDRGAVNAAYKRFGLDFRLYRFTNVYDNKTFREVSATGGDRHIRIMRMQGRWMFA